MKRFYLLIAFSIASLQATGDQLSFTIKQINKAAIAQNKTTIARNCFMKKYAQYGVKTAAFGTGLYILYHMLISKTISSPLAKDIPFTPEAFKELCARVAVLEKMKDIQRKQSWLGWGKSVTASTLNWVIPIAGYTFVSNSLDKVLHPDTLEWFVRGQTNLPRRFNNLASYANGFDECYSFEIERKQLYARALVTAMNSIMTSLEHVIAYMEYKAYSFNAEQRVDATLDTRCLQKAANQTAQKLQDSLKQYFEQPEQKVNVKDMVQSFKTEFERLNAHFGMIECEMS